jgi:non-specific protein-tyrosine kinase
MESYSFTDDLLRYSAILRRWAWLLVLVTLVAGLTGYIISKRTTPVYEAVTTMLINEAPATRNTDYSSIMTSERLAQTYSQLMTKQPILEGVLARLGLTRDVSDLKEAIQVQPVRDTTLIEVRVEDTNPGLAADIANSLVAEFTEQNQELQASRYAASKENLSNRLAEIDAQIQDTSQQIEALSGNDPGGAASLTSERSQLEAALADYRQAYTFLLQSYEQVRLAEAQSTANIIQAEPAVSPERPIRPRTLVNTLLAAIVGFLAAAGLVLLIEAMDDTLKGPDQVANELNLPVLGLISRHNIEDGKPVTLAEPRSQVAEAFRSLRTNIQFASVDNPLRTLLVTSPTPAEGKSTVAVNLGVVIAQGGKHVAILDADLRRPRVHTLLGLANRSGMSDLFVRERGQLDGALQKTETSNLSVLTSGDLPPNPAELLGSEKMTEIVRMVQEQVEVIIIDSPPMIAVTDSAVLAPRVDGVLLVLKPGVTQMAAARQTIEQLRRLGANLLGAVLNEVDLRRSRYYYHHYKGYYYSGREYYGRSTGLAKSNRLKWLKPTNWFNNSTNRNGK